MGIYTGLTLERVCVQFFRKREKTGQKRAKYLKYENMTDVPHKALLFYF